MKKATTRKRLFCALLVLSMLLGMLPAFASAADGAVNADIDFTNADDAGKFEILGQTGAAIAAGTGLTLTSTRNAVEPCNGQNSDAQATTPEDLIQIPVGGNWEAVLEFRFSTGGAANGYYQFFGFYASEGDDFQNMVGIRGGDGAMQDFLRQNGTVSAETQNSTPGLDTNDATYWYKIVKEDTTYTCYRSADGASFTEMFAFADSGIEADYIIIDAYTGMTAGYQFTLKSLALEMFGACDHVWTTTETVAPTCIEPGYTKQTCTECGRTKTIAARALGHNYVNDVCTNCGAEKGIYVFAASDFQSSSAPNTVRSIINRMVADGYNDVEGAIWTGDYGYDSQGSAKNPINNDLLPIYPAVGWNPATSILCQGNHEYWEDDVFTPAGAHESASFAAYHINEDEFPSTNAVRNSIKEVTNGLIDFLNEKLAAGYTKPVFIVSHVPLHATNRWDNVNADVIYDVVEQAAAAGLNIIVLTGHNHSKYWQVLELPNPGHSGHDNANYYFGVGEQMPVYQGDKFHYEMKTVNATYMTPGYCAGNVNGGSQCASIMEIQKDCVYVTRYATSGKVMEKTIKLNHTVDKTVQIEKYEIEPPLPEEKIVRGTVMAGTAADKNAANTVEVTARVGQTVLIAVGQTSGVDKEFTFRSVVTGANPPSDTEPEASTSSDPDVARTPDYLRSVFSGYTWDMEISCLSPGTATVKFIGYTAREAPSNPSMSLTASPIYAYADVTVLPAVDGECEHDFVATVTAPTCTEGGYTTYVCSKCQEFFKGNEVAALGHNYVDGTCSHCGKVQPAAGSRYMPAASIEAGKSYVIVANDAYALNTAMVTPGREYRNGVTQTLGASPVTVDEGVLTSEVTDDLLWTFEALPESLSPAYNGETVYLLSPKSATGEEQLKHLSGGNSFAPLALGAFDDTRPQYSYISFGKRADGSTYTMYFNGPAEGDYMYSMTLTDGSVGFEAGPGTAVGSWSADLYGTPIKLYELAPSVHEHNYTTTVTAPTCTEGGYTTFTCACGDSYKGSEVDALGHNYVDGVCTRCGKAQPAEGSYMPAASIEIGKSYVIVANDAYALNTAMVTPGREYRNGVTQTLGASPVTVDEGILTGEVTDDLLWTFEALPESLSPAYNGETVYLLSPKSGTGEEQLKHLSGGNSFAPLALGAFDDTRPQYSYISFGKRADGSTYTMYFNGPAEGDYMYSMTLTDGSVGFEAGPGTAVGSWSADLYGTPIKLYELAPSVHEHSYTAAVTAPTCTEGGYTTYTCACGDSYVADEVPALGHDYVNGKCTVCGEKDPDYRCDGGENCPAKAFTDAPKAGNWAHAGIDYCIENNLMNGVSETIFRPNGTVTRGQLVTILYRIAGQPAFTAENSFTDVKPGKFYTNAVIWAAENEIVNGYAGNIFKPDAEISREQIATILYRYAGSPAVTGTLDFPDANKAGSYAVNALIWATQEGLINGINSNNVTTLSPKANATRAQIAAIIMRYLESK